MRTLILASAAVLTLSSVAFADTYPPPSLSKEATEAYLRDLDNEQLRLLRLASRSCPNVSTQVGKAISRERDPCVIASTDKAVLDTGDPDLEAFHAALPQSERYDENRTSTAWRIWVK
jgi:hypothetical protein